MNTCDVGRDRSYVASISSFGASSTPSFRSSRSVAARELVLAQLFDGERTLREIQTAAMANLAVNSSR